MSDLGPKFYQKLLEVSNSIGMPPEHLLNVMGLESGYNPAVGSGSSAVGLVQIMPKFLSKLGYQGSASDFRKEPPEVQLVYIERLIRGNMNAVNGGAPFKSLTHYYVSNFLPACLTKSDVKAGDPNAILAEQNPTESHIPHCSIEFEKKVYAANSGLDTNKDGKITFGDLTAKLASVASRPAYREQLSNLKKYTGHEPNTSEEKKTELQPTKPSQEDSGFIKLIQNFISKHVMRGGDVDLIHYTMPDKTPTPIESAPTAAVNGLLDNLLDQIRASEKTHSKLYKHLLPENNLVIRIFANDKTDAIEFGRILCSALDEELLAKAYTHANNDDVEVECNIHGPQKLCYDTVSQLTCSIAEAFKYATIKIGGIDINTQVVINKKSSYSEITLKSALSNYRKFMLKFA